MSLMMIPNIIFGITHNENQPQVNKTIEALEQVGRYGCFALMIINFKFAKNTNFTIAKTGFAPEQPYSQSNLTSYCIT